MKSGTRPSRKDSRDYDLLKTRKPRYGAVATLPPSYSVSNTLWVPDQENGSILFSPTLAPQPYGCTNFTQCQLCTNEDGVLYNPDYLESITHANAKGGEDVRVALKAVKDFGLKNAQNNIIKGQHQAYFSVRPYGAINFFDACRLAILSATSEKRGVSIGSPYWLQWTAVGPSGILPQPDYDLTFASWHNWSFEGWETIDDVLYARCQMNQGANHGKNGIVFMSREVFNKTMSVPGSVAFTIDKLLENEDVKTVGFDVYVQAIISYVRSLFGL